MVTQKRHYQSNKKYHFIYGLKYGAGIDYKINNKFHLSVGLSYFKYSIENTYISTKTSNIELTTGFHWYLSDGQ